jgi:hypothetical protein
MTAWQKAEKCAMVKGAALRRYESLPAWFLSRPRHGGSHSLHNLTGTYP